MDKSQILNKIKAHYKFKTNAGFARYLGITSQNLAQWNARNTFDASILATKCREISADWLITGEGEMLRKEQTNNDETISTDVGKCLEIIKEKDKMMYDLLKNKDDQMNNLIALIEKKLPTNN